MKKREYLIYSDLHKGGPHQINEEFIFTDKTILLGDNFDIKSVLRKDLESLRKARSKAIWRCKNRGGVYISGNHALVPFDENLGYAIKEDVLFVHGDVIAWGMLMAKFQRKFFRPGKSFTYYQILKFIKRVYPEKNRIKKTAIKRAHKFALKNNCKTIVMGHFHPKKLIEVNHEGVRIIFVPRGKTVLEI